ncbi:MAG TPA: universal stress protein [Terriglobia bacterium]|nr:universal stress protein [Terriglobia bacterium]
MSEREGEFVIRRILVALDASRPSLAALEAAAGLAASVEAELLGIFVEDINLLRLASLPFARQVSYASASAEPLDTPRMERELRVKAEQARSAMARAAERAQVQWSFRVVRGRVAPALLEAASEADVLTVGKGASAPAGRALGSTARAVTANAPQALLLVQHGAPLAAPVVLVYDGSPGSRQALGAAVRLAIALGNGLTVFVVAETPQAGERLTEEVSKSVEGSGTTVHFRPVRGPDVTGLLRAVRREPVGVLVLSAAGVLGEESVRKLLHQVENPVLLIGVG